MARSLPTAVNASLRVVSISTDRLLRACGRLSVSTAMESKSSRVTSAVDAGRGPAAAGRVIETVPVVRLLQHLAGLRDANCAGDVLGPHVAFTHLRFGRGFHGGHVAIVIAVALFKRG